MILPTNQNFHKQCAFFIKYFIFLIRLENFVMPFHLLKMKTNSKLRKIISGHVSQMAISILSAAWHDFYFQHTRCQKLDKLLNLIPITHLTGSEKQFDQNMQCCLRNHSVKKRIKWIFWNCRFAARTQPWCIYWKHKFLFQKSLSKSPALGFKIPASDDTGNIQVSSKLKIIHVLKKKKNKNLLPGVTKLLSNSHCRQLIWFMWRLLSWITGPVSKRKAIKATGRGW